MEKLEIQVGAGLRAALAEAGKNWKAAEAGNAPPPSRKLCFVD